ncbi:MAG: cytochrome c biogenesis protein ResB [Aquificaceae bacterium]|nr:cytochrome c biogenesis protein ResB [Aquificaceae bacterium]MDW8097502.1 cytochrome c biogenesis protein ResB [Aquificaceae bacterium]
MEQAQQTSKGYALLVGSLIVFTAVLIVGLFHLEHRGVLYFALLGGTLALFSFSLLSYALSVLSYLRQEYAKRKSFFSFLFDFLADLRLALFLMVVLGILSMLGSTYVQQGQPIEFYLDRFGADLGYWLWRLWITDVFRSWYYIGFIVLLAINLTACSFKRLPRVWVQSFTKERFQKLDNRLEEHLKPIVLKVDSSGEKFVKLLRRQGFRVYKEEEGDRTYFYAEKGRYARLGVYVVHVGLLVIMAGALVDALLGVRGSLVVQEGAKGDTLLIPAKEKALKLPFQVELKDFRIVSYQEEFERRGKQKETPFAQAIASFESDIRIIQKGKVVSEGTTAVNSPFDFGTYRIFQATYGLTGQAGRVRLAVFDKKLAPKDPQSAFIGHVELQAGKVSEFRDMLLAIDRSTLNVEDEQKGFEGELKPALVVKVLREGKAYDVPVVYSPELTVFAQSQLADLSDFPYSFFLVDFEPQFFSGFQVSRQPGTPIVWLGSAMVVGGMFLAFYTVHRKVWAKLEGATLKVAFWSHKFKEEFKRDFLKSLEVLQHESASDGKQPDFAKQDKELPERSRGEGGQRLSG